MYLAAILFSPIEFPVNATTFNYASVIFGAITIFGLLSWLVIPEDRWLPAARLSKVHKAVEE